MRKLYAGLVVAAASCLWQQGARAQEPSLFDKLDANKDGVITADEAGGDDKKRIFERLLRTGDKNKDGKLTREEFAEGTKAPAPERDRPDERPRGPDPREFFERFDKNGDGKIAKEEAPEGLQAQFARIDANKDGFADKEELTRFFVPRGAPPEGRPGGPNIQEIFERFDKNSDGKLSKDEAPDRFKENFDRIDANKDGTLDKEEVAKALIGTSEERRPGADFYVEMFKRQDANKDGKLTADEVPEDRRPSFQDMLKRAGKESVTVEEFIKLVSQTGEPGRRPDAPPPGTFGFPGGPLMRALDANRDGQISADEIAGAAKALAALDKNGDGKLTSEELMPVPPPGVPRPEVSTREFYLELIKQANTNGDGKLSKEEAPPFIKGRFEQIDANKDGFIDKDELQTLLPRFDRRPDDKRPDDKRRDDKRREEKPKD